MARKCSICKKPTHNARTCPNKGNKPTIDTIKAKVKTHHVGTKYPSYFYENAPSWVAALEKAGLKTTPEGRGANAKSCGNCKFLVPGRTVAMGEPYCSKNKAAVRGQWFCPKWMLGEIQKINVRKLGEDV